MRFLFAALAALILAANCFAQTPALHMPGALGMTLTQLQQTEFVKFFHFEIDRNDPDSTRPGYVMHFYVSNSNLKGSINLLVLTKEGDEKINRVALMVRRDFIDDPKNSYGARYIVDAFLKLAPNPSEAGIAKLLAELKETCENKAAIAASDPDGSNPHKRCGVESDASGPYLVFLGVGEKYRMQGADSYAMMQNTNKILNIPLMFVELGFNDGMGGAPLPAGKAATNQQAVAVENPAVASPPNAPAASAGSATAPAPDIRRVAFIGKTRDEIQSTEMFSFFHFEKMQDSPVPGQQDKTLTIYGQQGRFKGKVMMGVISNNTDGRILHASVSMTRDFIDNAATALFARDLAKSFLANAPGAASAELNTLSSEIWSGCFNSNNTMNYEADGKGQFAHKQCPAESDYSKAYRVFAGKDRAYQITIPASQPVALHNTTQTSAPAAFFIDIGEP